MPGEQAATGLRGRTSECRALDRLLESARAGLSATLVLRGEPGVGKTALLDYIVERASDCRLARVASVETEMGFAFAARRKPNRPISEHTTHVPWFDTSHEAAARCQSFILVLPSRQMQNCPAASPPYGL